MRYRKGIFSALMTGMLITMPLQADETKKETQQLSKAQIAKMAANPLSYLWMLATQYDYIQMDGDVDGADKLKMNRFTIMPIMPMQLTESTKLVFRPWLPLFGAKLPYRNIDNLKYSGATLDPGDIGNPDNWRITGTDYHGGMGDVGFWAALTSNEGASPPFVWGAGITTMFDTASRDQFGTGKNAAGPMGVAFYFSDRWIVGAIAQHWVAYSGDSDRQHVSLTDVQYVLRYRINEETYIGMAPNMQYNWVTNDYLLPVGGGGDTIVKLGRLPVKVGAEIYYYAKHGPDAIHNDWQFRVFIIPILPSPAWSHKPIF